MAVRISIVVGYLGLLLLIGWRARRRAQANLTDYILGSRSLPTWVLVMTIAATNFSAFTVFGFAGAGWEAGYAYYPIMAFGTGFMAVSFVLIGVPAWRIGKAYDALTPPEVVGRLTGSRGLQLLLFLVMTVFTLPYLAMQPMAAGYALESLLGIPYFAGAGLVTVVMLAYTFLGGFRGVSWTDALQGGMMLGLLVAAVAAVAGSLGGLTVAQGTAQQAFPELYSRPGLGSLYTPGIWFGYMALWLLCDPVFPQLFQRFLAARSPRALSTSMGLYPLITGFLFLLPVTIGVLGRVTYPALPEGTSPDQILPLMLAEHVSPVVEALVLTAALAALMSTLDSQLLTLSSMFTRDVWAPLRDRWRRRMGLPEAAVPLWVGKVFVVALALGGLAIAYHPPATFRVLATQTFTGLAALFPTVVAVLYWKRMNAVAGIASILTGEALVAAYALDWLPTLGTLPVIPVVGAATIVLVGIGWCASPMSRRSPLVASPVRRTRRSGRWAWVVGLAGLFALANDAWNWGESAMGWLGYPWWVWRFAGLCVLLSAVLFAFARWLGTRRPACEDWEEAAALGAAAPSDTTRNAGSA